MVVQEMGLVDNLSINMNLFLGDLQQFSTARFGFINQRKTAAVAQENMEKWGMPEIPLNALASTQSVEIRKLAEVIRALSVDPEILILDEVTQALSQDRRQVLYSIIKRCKERNVAVLMISHDLEEMLKITDRITVLRDGCVVGTRESASLNSSELKQLLVGREFNENYYRDDTEADYDDEVLLEVRNLSTSENVNDISFDLHRGEILAVCGLSDGGIHDLGRAVFGLEKHTSGSVVLKQTGVKISNAIQALRNGIGYLPKDRDGEALMLNANIKENAVLPSLDMAAGKAGYLQEKKLSDIANDTVETFDVKCVDISQTIGDLSGGNKQKINLGRWTIKGSDILILDCPTRGVDVGVKANIYQLLKDIKAEKKAIMMISDELPEAIGMADRVLVMKNGSLSDIIPRGPKFTEEELIEVMI